jgi:Zn-dependent protease with chaperone function
MRATYYDGRSARARDVDLTVDAGYFVVTGDGIERREPEAAVAVTDAIGSTPRVLRFVDGASCEVGDHEGFAAMLAAHGLLASKVSKWEKNWKFATASVAAVAVAAVVGYLYVLPAMARSAADRLPPAALTAMSARIEQALDALVFTPSELSEGWRMHLRSQVKQLALPESSPLPIQLEFRHSESLGANALALPSGTVILTDALVTTLDDDRLVLAVVAHEAGHVQRRHGARQVIQSSIVGILMTWYLGDIGALGVAAPTALLQAKYSRDLERDADDYAAETLRLNGLDPSFLADALRKIEASHGAAKGSGDDGALPYLSSHPATAERLARLEGQGR